MLFTFLIKPVKEWNWILRGKWEKNKRPNLIKEHEQGAERSMLGWG